MKISLYHRLYGPSTPSPNRAPVVLLHGLMGYASNWGKVYPELAKDRAVLVYDQRGHGRSEKPPKGYSPDDYAGDLIELLDSVGWTSPVHVVGHSMGGRVAMYFAAKFPERTRSLTLEDSGAESRPDRMAWLRSIYERAPTPFPDKAAAQEYFARDYAKDPLTGSFLLSNMEDLPGGGFGWRFDTLAMEESIRLGRAAVDASALYQSINKPILLIRGGLSQEFPQDEAERMAAIGGHVRLAVVPGSGHYVHSTHSQEFLSILRTFLNANDLSA